MDSEPRSEGEEKGSSVQKPESNRVRTLKVFCLLGIGVLILWIVFLWPVFHKAATAAEGSTVGSMCSVLKRHPPTVNADGNWKRLGDQEFRAWCETWNKEIDSLWVRLSQKGKVLDKWGGGYQMAYRRSADGDLEFAVLSKGPDGRLGTADDIFRMMLKRKVRQDEEVRESLVRDGVWEERSE